MPFIFKSFSIVLIALVTATTQNVVQKDSLSSRALNDSLGQVLAFNLTVSTQQELATYFKAAITNLKAKLPLALTDVYLKDSLNNLESVYLMQKEKKTEKCFKGFENIKENIQYQASLYLKICLSHFQDAIDQRDEALFIPLFQGLENLRKKLALCDRTIEEGENETLWTQCINKAKSGFDKVNANLTSILEKRRDQNIDVKQLTQCVTLASNKGIALLRAFATIVKACISDTSENVLVHKVLNDIINVSKDIRNVFIEQTLDSFHETEELIRQLEIEVINLDNTVLQAYAASELVAKDAKQLFTYIIRNTEKTLSKEARVYDDSEEAKQCVNNFTVTLNQIRDKGVTDLHSCSASARVKDLSKVESIKKDFINIVKNFRKDIILECMSNTSNFFPIGGIRTCIRDERNNNAEELASMEVRIFQLQQDSEANLRKLHICMNMSLGRMFRQESKGKSDFDTCIRKNTIYNNYIFPFKEIIQH